MIPKPPLTLLLQVICTSRDGDKFWRMPECYIRGSNIKYLRWVQEQVQEQVQVQEQAHYSLTLGSLTKLSTT